MIYIIWLALTIGVAYLGDSRRIGFGWALFWALLLSPLIGFAIVMASPRKGTYEEELARLQGGTPAVKEQTPRNTPAGLADELEKLKRLYEGGAISEEEYNKAKGKLLG